MALGSSQAQPPFAMLNAADAFTQKYIQNWKYRGKS